MSTFLKDWVYKKSSLIYNYLLQDIFPLFPGFRLHLDTLDILEILDIVDIVDTVFPLIQQDWRLAGSYHTRLKPCQCLPRRFSKLLSYVFRLSIYYNFWCSIVSHRGLFAILNSWDAILLSWQSFSLVVKKITLLWKKTYLGEKLDEFWRK